jgi:hypothetical protein
MLANVWDTLFGCWHKNYTFPRSIRRGQGSQVSSVTGTYVVCLDCGKELPYDWNTMRVVPLPREHSGGMVEPVESYVGK